ncbi:ABC transporter ATP-binding protein [Peptacetobacter sp. AB800]|uniref:ABC transporter ATP-binding protein n=1 Tax=Peptacetobacter sp. AB800 TaxID=3388428 RepID=UPI0039FC0695
MENSKEVLLEIKNLKKSFHIKNFFGKTIGVVNAVNNVSFDIYKGETFGLVGESGCGKSTLGRCLLKMQDVSDGNIIYNGTDITTVSEKEWDKYRNKIQIIFQDPYSSLNPSWTVKQLIEEPLKLMGLGKDEIETKIKNILSIVRMNEEDMEKFPYEFSGGQRQRIGIARAVISDPEFIFCDEPVSALDVSVQAQVINMLKDLQKEFELTYLFTSHDLSMVYYISDRIGVMYLGNMVEIGDSEDVFRNPVHPYTKGLIASIPTADDVEHEHKDIMRGEQPGPMNIPKGCCFSTRCPYADERCKNEKPELREVKKGHVCACFKYEELI